MKRINEIDIIGSIFAMFIGIVDKIEIIRKKIDPKFHQTIAIEIRDCYRNSDLDPKTIVIVYRFCRGIAGLIDSSIEKMTPQRLDRLIIETKEYYFDNKTNFRLLKESLELYKYLDENLNEYINSS
jgi:hypothetical protein